MADTVELLPCEKMYLPNPPPPPTWLPKELYRPPRLPPRPTTTTALHHRNLVASKRMEAATLITSPWSNWEIGPAAPSWASDSFVTTNSSVAGDFASPRAPGSPRPPRPKAGYAQPVSATVRSEHVRTAIKGDVCGASAAFSEAAAFERSRRYLVRQLASTKGRLDAIRRRSRGAPMHEGDAHPANGRLDQSTPFVESHPPAPPRSARGSSRADASLLLLRDGVGELGLESTSGLRAVATPDPSGIYPPPLPGSARLVLDPPPVLSPRLWREQPAHKGPMGARPPPPPWQRERDPTPSPRPAGASDAPAAFDAGSAPPSSRAGTALGQRGAWRAVMDAGGAWRAGRPAEGPGGLVSKEEQWIQMGRCGWPVLDPP